MLRKFKLLFNQLCWLLIHAEAKTSFSYISFCLFFFTEILKSNSLKCIDDRFNNNNKCIFKIAKDKILIAKTSYLSGVRELCGKNVYNHLPGFEINHTDTIIDLGANVGIFTVLAALQGGKVFAVEAQENFIPIIIENLKTNSCLDKVTIIHGIIGSRTGILSNIMDRKNCSHWGKEPKSTTIEEIIKTYQIATIDFLKVDIEGSEFDLFNNEANWLSIVKRISMEVHQDYGDVQLLINLLNSYNFKVLLYNSDLDPVKDPKKADYLYAKRVQ